MAELMDLSFLDRITDSLIEKMRVDEHFMSILLKKGVITNMQMTDIRDLRPIRQRTYIVDSVRQGTQATYKGFKAALAQTLQGGALSILEAEEENLGKKVSPMPKGETGNGGPKTSKASKNFNPDELANKIMQRIGEKRTGFIEKTAPDEDFFNHLAQCNVIVYNKRKDLLAMPEHKRMSELLDYMKSRSATHQLLFCKSLIETDQAHALTDVLGLTETDIDSIKSF